MCIVGTHPHVLQDAQWLTAADGRRSFVAYSLGNFLSTQSQPESAGRRDPDRCSCKDHPAGRLGAV
ncbi:MAG: CapA family protein [Faecalibacterium prausnitzii]